MTLTMTDETQDDRMRRLMKDQYQRPLPKRFYTTVEVGKEHQVLLDGRPVRTPLKALLRLPNATLAEAVADEWRAQQTVINPGIMPLTRLANAAIDRAEEQRPALVAEIVSYANADLVCYRADRPPELVRLQQLHWDPVLAWAEKRLNVIFVATVGVAHHQQSEDALSAIQRAATRQDNLCLTATYNLVTLLGSALIPFMLLDGALAASAAWSAANVDEDYQISEWGLDDEAKARRDARKQDFDAFVRFIELIDD